MTKTKKMLLAVAAVAALAAPVTAGAATITFDAIPTPGGNGYFLVLAAGILPFLPTDSHLTRPL